MSHLDPVNGTAVIGVEGAITSSSNALEVIAGYQLERRLGIGSYGEVWLGIGPGGLPKAVKILHGSQAGALADMELKSLERIRELRHPFLLNIERIEIDRDRVVIVTELADRNLEDRFREMQRDKKPGIPRDELLRYLREAADALDFIYDQQQLQHLDIKPENLMLQGEHIKIGDFGLIKRVNQTSASMVGGFTPLYAPPEVFEGTPGSASDQYSLAIVYQVMLTGTPPFAGRTAAQLMSQHLRSKPDLTPLPPADRSTVARALSKTPSARFSTCREFVEALMNRRPSGAHARPLPSPQNPGKAQMELDVPELPRAEIPENSSDRPSRRKPQESRPLAAVAIDPTACAVRPALFVGLGGVGGQVVAAMQARFQERFGNAAELPAFAFLHIDSDSETLNTVPQSGLETLPIPLADSKSYREKSAGLLEWLSRRWLFNIPRSRKVQNMRPLGRLALFDHRRTVRARLKCLLQRVTSQQALLQTKSETGMTLDGTSPDIYVIAATGGGTGSGGVIDLGYVFRDLSVELGFETPSLLGILLPGTRGYGATQQVELANTVSCLQEVAHFGRQGLEYTSEFLQVLSSTSVPAFDQTYVVPLGEGLDDEALVREIGHVSKYLTSNAVGSARPYLETWRREHRDLASTSDDCVRTIGLASPDEAWRKSLERAAAKLCFSLITRWSSELERFVTQTNVGDTGKLTAHAELLDKLGLSTELIDRTVMQLVGQATREDLTPRIAECANRSNEGTDAVMANLRRLVATIDRSPEVFPWLSSTLKSLKERLESSATRAIEELKHHVLARWRNQHDLRATLKSLLDVQLRLRQVLKELRQSVEAIDRQCLELLALPAEGEEELPLDRLLQAGEQAAALSVARKLFEQFLEYPAAVSAGSRHLFEEFAQLGPVTEELARRFEAVEISYQRAAGTQQSEFQKRAEMKLSDTQRLLPDQIVNAFCAWGCRARQIDLFQMMQQGFPSDQCAETLLRAALSFLLEVPCTELAEERLELRSLDRSLVSAARPHLERVGGEHRVLAVLPPNESLDDWRGALRKQFSDCVSLTTGPMEDVLICAEVEGISVETLISELAHWDPKTFEIAGRVHTRTDIQW